MAAAGTPAAMAPLFLLDGCGNGKHVMLNIPALCGICEYVPRSTYEFVKVTRFSFGAGESL